MRIVNWSKSYLLIASACFGVILSSGETWFPQLMAPAVAQVEQSSTPLPILWPSFEPGDRGSPSRRAGAGSRGGCLLGSPRLRALLPQETKSESPALTVDANPVVFWAMPRIRKGAKVEFRLWDEDDRRLYSKMLTVKEAGGIVSFRLPESAPKFQLQTDQTYRWTVAVRCNPKSRDRSGDQFVEGWVKRVVPAPQLQQQLGAATNERDRARAYAQAGIWHNTVELLVNLHRQHPETDSLAATDWRKFLQSADLEMLSEVDLLAEF